MAIIGVASIRVRPDLTKFRSELDGHLRKINVDFTVAVKADTTKAERQIRQFAARMSGLDVKIDANVDGSKIRRAIKDLDKFKSVLGDVARTSGRTTRILATNTARVVALSVAAGSLASTLSGTASVIGGLGSAIAAMGAAAVGVGVAGLTAVAALGATVKIATIGMGDAFKAVAEGDAQALQEALKNMAPAAREFVTEVAKLKPIFDKIRLDTQAALFKGLGSEVLQTGRALQSTFGGLFVNIATSLNFMAIDVARFLREARTMADLKTITKNVSGGFREMVAAARPITQIIIDIVKSATSLLPDMGRSIENVAKKFAEFIRVRADSGELTEFFRQGIETVKQFGRILRDFGVGISNVFKIGSSAGGGFLNILERAAQGFRDFTESIGGQFILSTVFNTINDIAGAFGRFLGSLKPLLPVLGQLFRVLSDSVIRILDELGPILEKVGRAVVDALIETLPILVPVVIDLADGFGKIIRAIAPLLPTLAKTLDALTPLIDPLVQLVEEILPPLIDLIKILNPVIEFLAKGLGLILDVIGGVVDGFANLSRTLQNAADPIGTFEKLLGGVVGLSGDRVSKGFRQVGHDAMTAIEEGIEGKKQSLFGLLNSTLGELKTRFGIGAQDGGLSGGRTFMEAVNDGFRSQESALQSTINRIVNAVLGILTGKQTDFAGQGRGLSNSLATGLTQGQQEAVNRVRAMIDALIGALTGKRQSFEQEGRAISQRLGGGISSGQQDAVNAARTAVNAVANAFGGVSLFSEGAAIIASLRSGIVSGIQAVKNVLTSMTSLIPQWKGPETVDKKLLVPAGKAIMDGLMRSIEAEIPALRAVLSTVTGEVTGAFSVNPSVTARSFTSFDATGFEPTPVVVTVKTNEGAMAGFINGEINANNRTIKRFGMSGVSA